MLTDEQLRTALSRVWNMGQTYWQQADSESYSENRRSDETRKKYLDFVDETVALLSQAAPVASAQAPAVDACQVCNGTKGGVAGNENIIGGKVVCDYCHADRSYSSASAVYTQSDIEHMIDDLLFDERNGHDIDSVRAAIVDAFKAALAPSPVVASTNPKT
jgi:hypothetical protein